VSFSLVPYGSGSCTCQGLSTSLALISNGRPLEDDRERVSERGRFGLRTRHSVFPRTIPTNLQVEGLQRDSGGDAAGGINASWMEGESGGGREGAGDEASLRSDRARAKTSRS